MGWVFRGHSRGQVSCKPELSAAQYLANVNRGGAHSVTHRDTAHVDPSARCALGSAWAANGFWGWFTLAPEVWPNPPTQVAMHYQVP